MADPRPGTTETEERDCITCKFHKRDACRRYPPSGGEWRVGLHGIKRWHGVWPIVSGWCGEWKSRKERHHV